jgi:hypothetical protein
MDSANLTRDGSGCLGIVEFFQITGATHGVDWTCRGQAGLDAKTGRRERERGEGGRRESEVLGLYDIYKDVRVTSTR